MVKGGSEGKWAELRRASREDKDFFLALCEDPGAAVRERFGPKDFNDRDIELIEHRMADIVGDGGDNRPTIEELGLMWDLRDRLESDWGGPWAAQWW